MQSTSVIVAFGVAKPRASGFNRLKAKQVQTCQNGSPLREHGSLQ